MMDITVPQILGAVSVGTTISFSIFQGAYYIGKGIARLEKVEDKVEVHDERLNKAGL